MYVGPGVHSCTLYGCTDLVTMSVTVTVTRTEQSLKSEDHLNDSRLSGQ